MKLDHLCNGLDVADDEQAINIFRSIRWANGVYCPKCRSFEIIMAGGGRNGKFNRYICKDCNANFNDLTGTIFHNSKMSLGEIFFALLNLNNKTVKHLSKELSCSKQSIHRLSKKLEKEVSIQTKRKQNI